MLKSYFKIAWRNISRHKVYSFINILGLAIGICGFLVIFLIVHHELTFDTFHPDKERIYRVGSLMPSNMKYNSNIPPPAPTTLREEISGLETVTGFYPYEPKITIYNGVQPIQNFDCVAEGTNITGAILTDTDYFKIFKYEWLIGNATTSLHDPFKVVLTESRAHKYFGTLPLDKIIGRVVLYDDSILASVSGIVKDWNKNTDFPFTDFISISTIKNSFLKNSMPSNDWRPIRGNRWMWCFVKLSKSETASKVSMQFQPFIKKHISDDPGDQLSLTLQPLTDIHFNNNYNDEIRKANRPTLYSIIGIALFILVIASINYINLSSALSIQREKEIGVRKVLGSSRINLLFQFLTETFLITLFAVIIAVIMVNPILRIFHDFVPNGVTLNILKVPTILFILIVTLFTSLLAGFYPAKVLSSYLPVLSLKGVAWRQNYSRWNFRKVLIVFQFSISLVFIIATIVIGNQIRFMIHSDLGLKTDDIITINNWDNHNGEMKVLGDRIKQLPQVENVVLQGSPPIGRVHGSGVLKFKGKNEIDVQVSFKQGNENLIPFYSIKLLAGRNLLHNDSLEEFVINETFARALGFTKPEDALGKYLYQSQWKGTERAFPIIGVVSDFHENSFHDLIKPLVIINSPEMSLNSLGIKLKPLKNNLSNFDVAIAGIEKIWKEIYPNDPFQFNFLNDSILAYYEEEQKTSSLVHAAMTITIFISCMGLFGLAMFSAEKRTKEIGIRKVLGARVSDIYSMLSKDFIVLVLIALLIASPISWYILQLWLQNFVYRIEISWWIYLLAGLFALFIALLTITFQALNAATTNPIRCLRSE